MASVRIVLLFLAILVIFDVAYSQIIGSYGGYGGGIGIIGFGRRYGYGPYGYGPYGYGGYRRFYPPPPPGPFFGPPPPPLPFFG